MPLESVHVNCRNLIKKSWTDYQCLKRFMGAKPDLATIKDIAIGMAHGAVADELKLSSKLKEDREDHLRMKYYTEEVLKKGPYNTPLLPPEVEIYKTYKPKMDMEFPNTVKQVEELTVFESLQAEPCGSISNIMCTVFLGDSLSDWKDKDVFGKVHVADAAKVRELLGPVRRVPVSVFVRVEAADFGHSYTYIGHVDSSNCIMGVIYQSNLLQTLGDAMFTLNSWVSGIKFERKIDLEEHLDFLRTYKSKDFSTVIAFVEEHYLLDGIKVPEKTKQDVQKRHGDKITKPNVWVIIRPISQVVLEDSYQNYAHNVAPVVEAVHDQLV